jgi:hypothetical protein
MRRWFGFIAVINIIAAIHQFVEGNMIRAALNGAFAIIAGGWWLRLYITHASKTVDDMLDTRE